MSTAAAAPAFTIQRVNDAGDDYENVRAASSRSNGRRDVKAMAARTGVAHRLVVGDGWEYAPEVVLVAGDATAAEVAPVAEVDTAAELALVGDDTDLEVVLVTREVLVGEMADEMTGTAAWAAVRPATDWKARHRAMTERGPVVQVRYTDGAEPAEWADQRSWDCLWRARRSATSQVVKGGGEIEARVVRQNGEVLWTSADDADLQAKLAG